MFDMIAEAKVYWELGEVFERYCRELKLPDEKFSDFFSPRLLHAYRFNQKRPMPKVSREQLIRMAQFKLFHDTDCAAASVKESGGFMRDECLKAEKELENWLGAFRRCIAEDFGESLENKDEKKRGKTTVMENLLYKNYPITSEYNNIRRYVQEAYLRGPIDSRNIHAEKGRDPLWRERYEKLLYYVITVDGMANPRKSICTADILFNIALYYEIQKERLEKVDAAAELCFLPYQKYWFERALPYVATEKEWKHLKNHYPMFFTTQVQEDIGVQFRIEWNYIDALDPDLETAHSLRCFPMFSDDSDYLIGFDSFYGFDLENLAAAVNMDGHHYVRLKKSAELESGSRTEILKPGYYKISAYINDAMIRKCTTKIYKNMLSGKKNTGSKICEFKEADAGITVKCRRENLPDYIARLYTGIRCLNRYYFDSGTKKEGEYVLWQPARFLLLSDEMLAEEKAFRETLPEVEK